MKKIGAFLTALLLGVSIAEAQETENRDPLKWTAGNTTAKIGGFIHLVTAVDFGGAIDNEDFIPSYTAVQDKWSNENNFQITPNYSRLNLEVVQSTDKLGDVKAYIEVDFRGTSSVLRLRHAYVSAKGWTLGQTNSIAEDPAAMAPAINTQGTNSRSQLRSPQISYRYNFGKGFQIAASIEKPIALIFTNQLLSLDNLSPEVEELTDYLGTATQTMPDFLAYIQSKGSAGHIKLSAIYRNISYHDLLNTSVKSDTGYGVQASGSLKLSPRFTLYGQGIYGEGIARYINDLARVLTDLIPSTEEFGVMSAVPMWGGSAGIKSVITDDIFLSTTYSRAVIDRVDGYDLDVLYHKGDYAAATLFWSPLRNTTFGLEYLFGSHVTMDDSYAQANRIQVMAKYSF